ncbi:Mannitol dehydrogenase, C-terminal domain (plasmid) [Novosphingobium aromaticivorans DSM 12444]|uniref:Mannitol dehydrogenase, C-terminal domain n=1 Tax=Novosphingobium aromaticivorans (strain ATCC 700278 / DSM 12444 / CCUG 56034 / CIP 105152 / NBRC 16084 / F199) TaxID=279238 RepID=A4XEM3_NOVAD|nr:mannitol dehydrogenase family protein [Novosphingobium aromaticivorans]ABP64384.1 Mannitol dehydrogenase, C-terminal domain [Novosphingobium aromaticivorans DSM 12444]ABP64537.1 Mannitol dehydrogenase, C-terminal domain [Novosphingobium aromaticivorans DSM 12444]SCY82436.1 fructuronate reductase [Novosphingobium aromaticivorans]SCY97664.1 fructuronate reductase [Novosphingobium aromaticivorans]SCY98109.1 fructuronate reductase [Novosphingobium aromaticivorans]
MTQAARLSPEALASLPPAVARPLYDRDAQAVGIVHFGIGAFHRAHQAWYTDAAMNLGDRDWAITGVSLRSPGVARQMNPQHGLYALAERSGEGTRLRVVGSVRNVLVASEEPESVIAAVASPTTRVVSLTVTEKGYCRGETGDLDFELAHSLSFYYFVAQGLLARRKAGLPGVTLLPCDNLADNGAKLERLMRQYLERHEPDLVAWFEANCTCPSTMIDRIVPATTDEDRAMVADALNGLDDQACVVTEPFSQWVIEDRFAGPRPGWEAVGAQLVHEVGPYETAKLRMLNGAHSLLAYCGLAAGHACVHEAIADPALRHLAIRLMREEAAPTITPAPGQDLAAYADALIDRFANPALDHRLIQIAMDGSQKIPQRWLETLAANARAGRQCPAILAGIKAWLHHLTGANGPVDDPLATRLTTLATRHPNPADTAKAIFTQNGPLDGTWLPTQHDLNTLKET